MAEFTQTENNIIADVWTSFRALPGWVQFWVAIVLIPINMASLLFLDQSMGIGIAFLANIGMILNIPVVFFERGFSKLMAIPHLIPWTLLVGLLVFARPVASGSYDTYLWLLLMTNVISLIFDYPDAVKWLKGDRKIAGRV